MSHPSYKIRERLMRVSTDRSSPDYFHGMLSFEPWLNGKRLEGCVFADEAAGIARTIEGGQIQEHKGLVEIRPKRRLRLVSNS